MKNKRVSNPSTGSSVGLSVEEASGRLKFLLANAVVAAENARSSMLNTQSSFLIAAM